MSAKGPPYGIPQGFPDLLQRFVVHVLRNQPDAENIIGCAVDYFLALQKSNVPLDSVKIGRSNVMSYLSIINNENKDEQDPVISQQISDCLLAVSQHSMLSEIAAKSGEGK